MLLYRNATAQKCYNIQILLENIFPHNYIKIKQENGMGNYILHKFNNDLAYFCNINKFTLENCFENSVKFYAILLGIIKMHTFIGNYGNAYLQTLVVSTTFGVPIF